MCLTASSNLPREFTAWQGPVGGMISFDSSSTTSTCAYLQVCYTAARHTWTTISYLRVCRRSPCQHATSLKAPLRRLAGRSRSGPPCLVKFTPMWLHVTRAGSCTCGTGTKRSFLSWERHQPMHVPIHSARVNTRASTRFNTHLVTVQCLTPGPKGHKLTRLPRRGIRRHNCSYT